jgi:PST family polysaccharide transporter
MLFSQALKLACKLVSVPLLARLVAPSEHGLFAMASSVILLLALFRDAGLGAAAVQTRTLEPRQLTTLFWSHLGIGILLTVVTAVSAPAVAAFYATPEVTPLLRVASLAFLLIGAGGFARTQLERASRFHQTSGLESAAAVIGTLAMIGAALVGAGAGAFVAYLLVSEAVATLLAWRACSIRPSGWPQWASIRGLLKVGADVTAYQVIVYFVQQLDLIVVGRVFGPHALGLYNRSNQLLGLPNLHLATPLNQVAVVTLSRLGPESLEFVRHARTTAMVIAHLVLPLFAVCIILPDETVRLVLGAQWPDAAPLLRWLSMGAAAATLTSLGYAINVAAAQTRRLVLSAIAALPFTAAAVLWGSRHGVIGVAAGIAIVNMVLMGPRLWWALRDLPGGFGGYVSGLTRPAISMAVAMAGLGVGRYFLSEQRWDLRLAASLAAAAFALVILGVIWPALRREWRVVAGYLPLPWGQPAKNPNTPN